MCAQAEDVRETSFTVWWNIRMCSKPRLSGSAALELQVFVVTLNKQQVNVATLPVSRTEYPLFNSCSLQPEHTRSYYHRLDCPTSQEGNIQCY